MDTATKPLELSPGIEVKCDDRGARLTVTKQPKHVKRVTITVSVDQLEVLLQACYQERKLKARK